MLSRVESQRARAIHDALRTYPSGAPTLVLVDALRRTGLHDLQALAYLERLRDEGALVLERGRWAPALAPSP